jgi:hypothetical protein
MKQQMHEVINTALSTQAVGPRHQVEDVASSLHQVFVEPAEQGSCISCTVGYDALQT